MIAQSQKMQSREANHACQLRGDKGNAKFVNDHHVTTFSLFHRRDHLQHVQLY